MTVRSAEWIRCNRAIRAVVSSGLNDDDRKAIVKRVTGKDSMADCSDREMRAILVEINKEVPSIKKDFRKSTKKYIRLIHGLWAEAGKVGAVRHASREALFAYVQRMTKSDARPEGVSDLRQMEWLTYDEARPIIEGLKAMIERAKAEARK